MNLNLFHDHSNSSGQDSASNFDNERFKKVAIEGNFIEQSENENDDDSDSEGEGQGDGEESGAAADALPSKRNNYSKKISELKPEDGTNDKTKNIKKNCQSAKMSRQRKKMYLQLLEARSSQLKSQIARQRTDIKANSSRILEHIRKANRQKYKFIKQKLDLSRRLMMLSSELNPKCIPSPMEMVEQKQQLRMPRSKTSATKQQQNQPPSALSLNRSQNQHMSEVKIQGHAIRKQSKQSNEKEREKRQKKKKAEECDGDREKQKQTAQREEKNHLLDMTINAFLYKFGMNGGLKNDVIENLKGEWLAQLQSAKLQDNDDLKQSLELLQAYFLRIDQRCKKLDYLLRELQGRVSAQCVVKILLEKDFLPSP